MRIAVIPARGGSKRIPRKNLKMFLGRPIIEWSIDAALKCGCFDRILVSTDDDEIASIARAAGSEVPFCRPPELSDDHAVTGAVMAHAVAWISDNAGPVQYACCIYPTAPFIRSADIGAGLDALIEAQADYAFSVTAFASPVQRALMIDDQGRVRMFQPEHMLTRSQDLEPAYHDAGQFYWGRADAWLEQRPIFSPASLPLVLPRDIVQDIDTPADWDWAERMHAARLESAGDS